MTIGCGGRIPRGDDRGERGLGKGRFRRLFDRAPIERHYDLYRTQGEFPDIDTKSETLRGDPLAICKPTGAKHVDAAATIGNFTG